MLSAVIFDLDGTLVDTNATHVASWVEAFAAHGYKVPADRIGPEIGKGGDNLVPSVLGREADETDGEALREASKAAYLRLATERRFRFFDGARELLDELRRRGLRTAIATSSGTSTSRPPSPPPARTCASASTPGWARATSSTRSRTRPGDRRVKKLGVSPARVRDGGRHAVPTRCRQARRRDHARRALVGAGLRRARALPGRGAARDDGRRPHPARARRGARPPPRRAPPGLTAEVLEALMRDALAAARRDGGGRGTDRCVIAGGDGRVLPRGYNEMNRTQDKTAHAEIMTFRSLAGRVPLDARDLVMVSTLEPCVMCTGAAMQAAVDTIVYALQAPADSGTARVRPPESPEGQMPRIVGGVLARASRQLFERWYAEHEGEPQAEYVGQLLALTEGGVPADVFEAAGQSGDAMDGRAERPEVQGRTAGAEQ
jgi:tRNA(Arg) A34 adenosine deaminase TadA